MRRGEFSPEGGYKTLKRPPHLGAKLYRDLDHPEQWIAWSPKLGWVRFPAQPNGWAERQPVDELKTLNLHEVPLAQAFDTSLLEAFRASFPSSRPGTEAASDIDAPQS
jgi:hypothetical protein